MSARVPEAAVDPLFMGRWSPRAFSPQPVAAAAVASLFEAARWAPSAMNAQPWLFVYAVKEEDLARFRLLLEEGNRAWASRAPVLAFLFTRRQTKGGPNRWAGFDAGAAWISLALQAERLGLRAHAMAGIRAEETYGALGVPRDEYEVMVAVAVGHQGDAADLSDALRARERPTPRKPLAQVAVEGRFPS